MFLFFLIFSLLPGFSAQLALISGGYEGEDTSPGNTRKSSARCCEVRPGWTVVPLRSYDITRAMALGNRWPGTDFSADFSI